MDKLKYLIPVIAVLLNSGCASFGPTVRIETPEPVEDFVLVCDWASTSMFAIHGGAQVTKQNVYVVKSGEETHCGVAWAGGRSSSRVMHPVYWGVKITEEDDTTVYRYTETKLDYLDKQKEKFEAGFWDKYSDPGFEYANNLVNCNFGHQYFDYYSQVKEVEKEHFKRLYHEPMQECMKRTFTITKKYRPVASSDLPSAEVWMEKMWESNSWSKYK